MKRIALLLALAIIFALVSIVLAQPPQDKLFTPIRQIGKLRPQGIQYDPNFDRFVMVDLQGQLVLVDAKSYQPQHVLYKTGAYNAYKFSHDGRYLALALERRVELWDTPTGTLSATFEPEGALQATGPLFFTPDDHLLLISTVVPAPAAIRRSENDTSIIPWLWDVVAARGEARTTLANFTGTYPFFNFRNGLVIGQNNTLIAGVPSRLQVIDGTSKDLPVVTEIESSRLERDPIYVWRSLTDQMLYVNPQLRNNIVQVDTSDKTTFEIPLGRDLSYGSLDQLKGLKLSNSARMIGKPVSLGSNSLLRLIFGDQYREYQNYQHLTVMLLDILQPLTVPDDQMGFLIYTFNEESARGTIEFIRPGDVQQMVLHPDRTHLMVRRSSGSQPIEIYNLDTGVLEKTFFPAEPDGSGSHILAFDKTGDTIISDFQRFDAHTGAILQQDLNYTSGFDQLTFSDDSRKIVTYTGRERREWDIATGEVVRRETINIEGSVIESTPDGQRYLTQFDSPTGDGVVMEIYNAGTDDRVDTILPNLPNRTIQDILPSKDWQNYLVVYSAVKGSQHYPGNEIAVYNVKRGRLLFIAGDDLPQPDGRQYGWLDNQTIYVSSANTSSHTQPQRIYGIDYDPSGLPSCLVQAYPDQWQQWLPLWELFNLRMRADELGRLAQRLCQALPPANQVVRAFTPTPPYMYQADATLVPLGISGVPTCLTARFQSEALDYAKLWRDMTAGLPAEDTKKMETMLCEGLISSVGGIQPTPTVDINQLVPPTQTPVNAAPSTTDQNNPQQLEVMAINIETQERFTGSYVPPIEQTPERNLSLVADLFQRSLSINANNPVLSPDGTLLAITDANGFITVYRMAKSYDTLAAEQAAEDATQQAKQPRSLGLLPTATQPFNYVGQPRPTLTVTVTPTPPPVAQQVIDQPQHGQVQEFCPSPTLYDISAPPPEYAASGRLFVPPMDGINVTWVLDPASGALHPDDTLPVCGYNENCQFSFDGEWMLRQGDSIVVSRPDGSQATVLFQPEERPKFPQSFDWLDEHTLEYHYQGYLPDRYPEAVTLFRRFDPVTGTLTAPFLPQKDVNVNNLPTTVVAAQPGDGNFLLLSTPYSTSGAKYYIYDRQTNSADYFARVDNGSLTAFWHPLGRALYYRFPDGKTWYIFDPVTRQHRVFGDAEPSGYWSRDARYTVNWYTPPDKERVARLAAQQRLPKISVWDSVSGLTRLYCIPETGQTAYNTSFIWSPDNRYLVFTIQLPAEGDVFPQPTTTPDVPRATPTPVSLEVQYQRQGPRTVVLDTQTGSVTVLSKEVPNVTLWTENKEGR